MTNPTHIYQIKPVKPNLLSQIYQTKPSKPSLPNHTYLFYQTKPTKPNLPDQTYQTKSKFQKEQKQSAKTKFMSKIVKSKRQSKPDKLKLALSLAQLSPSLFLLIFCGPQIFLDLKFYLTQKFWT